LRYQLKQNKHLGLGPIIAVAGTNSISFVKGLNVADYIVDYRTQDVAKAIEEILAEEEKELGMLPTSYRTRVPGRILSRLLPSGEGLSS
jgi:hypothetical protein